MPIFGQKIPARVMRRPGGSGTPMQYLPNPPTIPKFTVRKLANDILQPVRPFTMSDKMFGIDVYQLRLIFADWPKGINEDFPIRQGDFLVIPVGKDANGLTIYRTYVVAGENTWPDDKIEVYVNIAPDTLS